ncbi:hypothetical protein KW786_01260 [Candidatus Parcubacteria bacterium]|nr:hypothetical protein [Candidatus Parcubacteria bacterium]
MKSPYYSFKTKVIELRKSGKSYGEINSIIQRVIPKSTLSDWCSNIYLTSDQKKRIDESIKENSRKGMEAARIINRERRTRYLKSIIDRNQYLESTLKDRNVAKVILSILYLGEGSKSLSRGSLCFGNSDPFIIDMFLSLMRQCYILDESKFRCTILCRSDHDIPALEEFWSKATKIPLKQFYKARIDARTIGKTSRNLTYKGVCRIDYFSADVFLDLMAIPKIIHKGP